MVGDEPASKLFWLIWSPGLGFFRYAEFVMRFNFTSLNYLIRLWSALRARTTHSLFERIMVKNLWRHFKKLPKQHSIRICILHKFCICCQLQYIEDVMNRILAHNANATHFKNLKSTRNFFNWTRRVVCLLVDCYGRKFEHLLL